MTMTPSTIQEAHSLVMDALRRGDGWRVVVDEGETELWGDELETWFSMLAPGESFELLDVVPNPRGTTPAPYVWVVLSDPHGWHRTEEAVGVKGPAPINRHLDYYVGEDDPEGAGVETHLFRIIGVRDEVMFEGVQVFEGVTEEALRAPMDQFGAYYGPVRIEWDKHPEWTRAF